MPIVAGSLRIDRDGRDRKLAEGLSRLFLGWRELTRAERTLALPVGAAVLVALGTRDALSWVLAVAAAVGAWAYVACRRAFLDRTSTAPYVAAFTTLLVCTAALPTVALFRLAQSRQVQLVVQDTQVGLARAEMVYRDLRISERPVLADRIAGYDRHVHEETEPARAATAGVFYDAVVRIDRTCPAPADARSPDWPYGATASDESGDPSPPRTGLARLLSARPVPLTDLTQDAEGTDLSRFVRGESRWWVEGRDDEPSRLVGAIPTSPGTVGRLLVSSRMPSRDLLGTLGPLRRLLVVLAWIALLAGTLGIGLFVARRVLVADLAPNRSHATLERIVDRVRTAHTPQRVLLVFSLPEAVERVVSKAQRAGFTLLRFGSLWDARSTPEARERLFLSRLEESPDEEGGSPVLAITDFRPDLRDPEVAREQIDLLERLRLFGGRAERSVLLVVARLPDLRENGDDREGRDARRLWSGHLARFSQRYGRDEGKPRFFRQFLEAYRDLAVVEKDSRWASLGRPKWSERVRNTRHDEPPAWLGARDLTESEEGLVEFDIIGAPFAISARTSRRLEKLLEAIYDECRWSWRLQCIGLDVLAELKDEILRRQDSAEPEDLASRREDPHRRWHHPQRTSSLPARAQLVSRIEFAALPYYQKVWDACDSHEKLVLHQLAREGVVNPKGFDTVLDLLNKGLVVRTESKPALRLINTSFTSFVLRTVRRSQVSDWEDEEGFSAWEVWKWVLPLPLLRLGVFLFVTQQDAVSNIVGLLIAVASLVPTGMNLYQHFQQLTTEREVGSNG